MNSMQKKVIIDGGNFLGEIIFDKVPSFKDIDTIWKWTYKEIINRLLEFNLIVLTEMIMGRGTNICCGIHCSHNITNGIEPEEIKYDDGVFNIKLKPWPHTTIFCQNQNNNQNQSQIQSQIHDSYPKIRINQLTTVLSGHPLFWGATLHTPNIDIHNGFLCKYNKINTNLFITYILQTLSHKLAYNGFITISKYYIHKKFPCICNKNSNQCVYHFSNFHCHENIITKNVGNLVYLCDH